METRPTISPLSRSEKQIYVINGFPGSGKTIFGTITGDVLRQFQINFLHTSSIDPIKHVLMPKSMWNSDIIDPTLWELIEECKRAITDLDWDGKTKDVYWRGVMSALKQKLTECIPSLVQNYIYRQVVNISAPAVIFVDIREPENIDALKSYVHSQDSSIPVRAIFIESGAIAQYDNPSDARVKEYTYDVSIDNTRNGGGKTLGSLRTQVQEFCNTYLISTSTKVEI